jgi:hypothetical protein
MASREREAAGERLTGTVPFLARFIAAGPQTCAPEPDLMPPTQVRRQRPQRALGTSLVSPLVDPLASNEGVSARRTPGQWP